MKTKRLNLNSLFLMAIGAGLSAILFLSIAYIREGGLMDGKFNDRSIILQLTTQMRINLASASEAEKNAAVAEADQASKTYADKARAATASVERTRRELSGLIATSGTDREKGLFARFSKTFGEFQQVENMLLELAVKNTNVKAYSLAFGPATEALSDLDDALNRLVSANAGAPNAGAVSIPAFKVQVGALRIQTLLAPHIAEATDVRMDQLEANMALQDEEVRGNLERLARMDKVKNRPFVEAAKIAYEKFTVIRKNILALSRENTNVRSLAISLDRKRKVDALCQETLEELQQTVQQSLTKWKAFNPRELTSPK